MKLLLAEDDAILADAVLTRLSRLGFQISHAADGLLAQQCLLTEPFDAVILDIGLPGQSGLDVLRNVRVHKPALPILILTALDSMEDRVAGLDAGADDYLVKPFEFSELEAHIRALLRWYRVASCTLRVAAGSLWVTGLGGREDLLVRELQLQNTPNRQYEMAGNQGVDCG